MPVSIESVTVEILAFVARHELTSVEDGWSRFLEYLRARRCGDIRTVFASDEVSQAQICVNDGVLDAPSRNPQVEWFNRFDQRDDVVAAFHKYRLDPAIEIV